MFCSSQCLDECSRQLKKLEELEVSFDDFRKDYILATLKALDISDNLDTLEEIYSDDKTTTVFDYNLNDPKDPETRKNMLKCSASLKKREKDCSAIYRDILVASDQVSWLSDCQKTSSILGNFTKQQGTINELNSISFQYKDGVDGCAVFLFASLLNHSCDPNVQTLCIDSRLAFVVNRPLKAGEQIFFSYK